MKILVCAGKDWGLQIYEKVRKLMIRHDFHLLRQQDVVTEITKVVKPDLVFFLGWSWILPPEYVNEYYCVCLHPSPLPKYRGGSPLQHQIIAGEKTSAVTLFKMTEKLDQGPILYQADMSLEGTLNDIFERIIDLGYVGLSKIIRDKTDNLLKEIPQDENQATYFKRRTPEMSEIDFKDFTLFTAEQIYNKVRALADPYPNAYIRCGNGTYLLLKEVEIKKDDA